MRKPRLLCIGHRGAMGHAPENTLSSIRKALELGTAYIEIDVYYVDGHIVVFHDDRLERTTDGAGSLCEQSFDYLRSLDAGQGQNIPTLEEVCKAIDSRANLNIELKEPGAAAPVAELLSTLIDNGWDKNRFLVSSVHHDELSEIKRLDQHIKLGVLIRGIPVNESEFAAELGAFSIHPSLDFVDQQFVDDAHGRGLKVFVYTVNQAEDIARMQEIGVDGVFTGFPERVLDNYAQGDATGGWN